MIDTQRLRRKILDLAIRGKLVPQDPADEPASVLLERIRQEKLQMVKEGKLKKKDIAKDSIIYRGDDNSHYEKVGDAEPVCIDDEIPFELPDGWVWARLGHIVNSLGGKTPAKSNKSYWENGSFPWITSKDMKKRELYDSQLHITDKAIEIMNVVPPESILIVVRSGILKRLLPVAVNHMATTINQDLKALISFDGICSEYIVFILMAWDDRIRHIFHKDGTTVDSIDFDRLLNLLVPIPPHAEQQILARTIDALFGNVEKIINAQHRLQRDFAKIRSKILDLAIRGKLVPQDPADEPASILLERIRQEKLRMVAEGKLKKKDIAKDSVIYRGDDNSYYERTSNGKVNRLNTEIFDLPDNWSWVRLGYISDYGSAPSIGADEIEDDAWILALEDIEKDTGKILEFRNKSDRPSLSAKRPFCKGQLLYSKLRPYLNKVLIAPKKGYCTSEMLPIELYGKCNPDYLRLVLMSDYFLTYANQCSYGVKMPRLGTNDGLDALIPLPPLKEQENISNTARSAVMIIESAFTEASPVSVGS